ncbi:MAG TPA: hypothetical protein VH186_09250 [Chloroflexia bacterium]|nr:hypothetical protein [Chloroflexia bacterium]
MPKTHHSNGERLPFQITNSTAKRMIESTTVAAIAPGLLTDNKKVGMIFDDAIHSLLLIDRSEPVSTEPRITSFRFNFTC